MIYRSININIIVVDLTRERLSVYRAQAMDKAQVSRTADAFLDDSCRSGAKYSPRKTTRLRILRT